MLISYALYEWGKSKGLWLRDGSAQHSSNTAISWLLTKVTVIYNTLNWKIVGKVGKGWEYKHGNAIFLLKSDI